MTTNINDVISLDNRAKIILEGIDDEITHWFLTPQEVPMWQYLGMSLEDYGQFLFNPRKWARNYVIRLHGELATY